MHKSQRSSQTPGKPCLKGAPCDGSALKRMGESDNYCERIQPMSEYRHRTLTTGEDKTERINPWSMTVCLDCFYCVPAWNGTGGYTVKMYQPVNNVNVFLIGVRSIEQRFQRASSSNSGQKRRFVPNKYFLRVGTSQTCA
ncbi:hypothetical protein V2K86_19285 [Pseudomonas alliivorans]|nr:hypothetical protein [Pseudomonas alliivorans]